MRASMTQRAYAGWKRYYEVEPWGPWRDNLHVALLAREVRRTRFPRSPAKLQEFMVRSPWERAAEAEQNLFAMFGATAVKVTAKEAEKRLKANKAQRKKSPKRGKRRD
jgi:hypothetical protein